MATEWKPVSEEVWDAGIQGAGGETVCPQSPEAERKDGCGGKFRWGKEGKRVFNQRALIFSAKKKVMIYC